LDLKRNTYLIVKIILVAAVSKNNIIGNLGKLPWHIPQELKHFKKITLGYPVIMGRKTWESLAKPLQDRINIVLTRNKCYLESNQNIKIFNSLELAIKSVALEKLFVIGGAELFSQTITFADEMYLSIINKEYEGDTYFPVFNKNEWVLESIKNLQEFEVHHYIRKVN
jgi:dihydrofolate reductase